jgi:Kef-type K+ transport system membrane component KefB
MSRLLKLSGLLEATTGLGLIAVPTVVVRLLLGSPLEPSAAIILGRVTGAALLALGVACWLARDDTQSRAARGLVAAMLLYNVAVTALLAFAVLVVGLDGVALWPAVVLHAVMAVWCIACLRRSPQNELN